MTRRDQIDHHANRALEELECARRATSEQAAHAHLDLSELHLGRMRTLSLAPPGPALRLVAAAEAERENAA
jgi:hypothetical protein